ncbi:hypothetical protein D3C81_2203190 [compost metagenome]
MASDNTEQPGIVTAGNLQPADQIAVADKLALESAGRIDADGIPMGGLDVHRGAQLNGS